MSMLVNPYVVAPTVPTFHPSDLGGYDWDLDADAIAGNDGDLVLQLPDVSGAGIDFGQATSGVRPTLKTALYNGHNAVRFAAGKALVPDPTERTLAAANTLVCVCTPSTVAAYILKGNGGQGGPAFITEFGGVNFEYFFTTTAGHERATFSASATGLHVLTLCKTDNTGNYIGYLDGVEVFNNPIHADDDWGVRTINRIGQNQDTTLTYDGDIARILHYSVNHASTSGLDDLHGYLLDRFGI